MGFLFPSEPTTLTKKGVIGSEGNKKFPFGGISLNIIKFKDDKAGLLSFLSRYYKKN